MSADHGADDGLSPETRNRILDYAAEYERLAASDEPDWYVYDYLLSLARGEEPSAAVVDRLESAARDAPGGFGRVSGPFGGATTDPERLAARTRARIEREDEDE